MKKNLVIVVLILIIIILSVTLGIAIGKSDNNKINNVSNTNNVDDNNKDNSNSEFKVISTLKNKIYDTKNGEKVKIPCDYNEYAYISVDIPKINSEKTGAKNINNKINEYLSYEIELINNPDFSDMAEKHKFSIDQTYNYVIKDDILYLFITKNIKTCGTGGGSTKTFLYNIKNDKQLNNIDIINKYNIPIETIKKQFYDLNDDLLMNNETVKNNFENSVNTLNDDYFTITSLGNNYFELTFSWSISMPTIKINI